MTLEIQAITIAKLLTQNDTLLEQNRELKEALRELIRFSASLKMTMGEALQHPDNFISSIDKAEALLNKYPEI